MNITLIGMSGVGKSVTGKKLAKRLNYEFLDIDKIIEKETGLKLQKIIDDLGDEEFLKIEERTILKLRSLKNCIISTGGSAIYSSKAMEFLKKSSVIVFLDAPFKVIQKGMANKNTRGIVGLKKKELKALFKERLSLYRKYTEITIEMPEDFNINSAVRDIIHKIFHK